jgi:uncharacterized protein YigE (DUF2233 family)
MTTTHSAKKAENRFSGLSTLFMASLISAGTLLLNNALNAEAFVRTHTAPLSVHLNSVVKASHGASHKVSYGKVGHRQAYAASYAVAHNARDRAKIARALKGKNKGKLAGKAGQWQAESNIAEKAIPPQNFIASLSSETIAPGVVHKSVKGPLSINVIDVDMEKAPVKVQPYMAGETFDRLKDVADHARESKALAAINANYFKKDGTPLGTLIVDGEWVAGPIFDRVSMGIDRQGKIKIDRVSLNGLLTSDNDDVNNVWVNNINQPRRHGTKLIAYTRRWGSYVRTPLEGRLVAVNAQGEVQDTKVSTTMGIPYGGFVLSDTKEGSISELERGNKVQLSWHTKPGDWQDVVEAVSGGPMLIKDGSLFVDLKDENFRKAWTGSQIRARTAIGVTADNHLLMCTVEGPHTLWDVAKFLQKMGAVDAMNLDGGGSTTMVVHGATVTRNANASQRRVASSIVVIDLRKNGIASNTPLAQPNAYSNGPEVISDVSAAKNHLGELKTGKELTASLPDESSLEASPAVGTKSVIDDSAEVPGMIP